MSEPRSHRGLIARTGTGFALAGYAFLVTVACATAFIAFGRQGAGQAADWPAVLLWQTLVYALWIPAGVALAWTLRVVPPFSLRLIAAMAVLALAHALIAGALDAMFSRLPNLTVLGAAAARAPIDMLAVTGLTAALAGWRWRAETAELQHALAQARDLQRERDAAPQPERLMVSVGSRHVPVELSAVEWFGAAANYVSVHWEGREGLIRDTLQALEARLDARLFARIHRSTLVNLAMVAEARPAGGGAWRLTMRSGADLVVSRSSRAEILARLGRR